jgi:hypothetical protein
MQYDSEEYTQNYRSSENLLGQWLGETGMERRKVVERTVKLVGYALEV